MNSASKTAILPLLGLLAGVQLAAQSVTFAQLNDLALMKSLRKQTPSEWLEAQYALVWAVAASASRLRRTHHGRQPWGSASCRKASLSMASGWWCGNSAATISVRARF